MKLDINLEGMEEAMRKFTKLSEDVPAGAIRAMDENGEHLLAKSQELAPLDKGDLAGSGTKDPPKVTASGVSVEVGYNKAYAAKMHEDVYTPGPKTMSKPGNEAGKAGRKYMERPLRHFGSQYVDNFAAAVRRAAEGK